MHFRHKDTYSLKIKDWRTMYHANSPQKKAGVAILISNKVKFIPKIVLRDEEGHYIILKGSIQEEDITILNIYAPNVGAAKYINQLLTKVKKYLDNNTLGIPGWRSGLAPAFDPGRGPGDRDRIPRQAPGAWSLLLPLPVSLPLSLSLSLCDYHE